MKMVRVKLSPEAKGVLTTAKITASELGLSIDQRVSEIEKSIQQ